MKNSQPIKRMIYWFLSIAWAGVILLTLPYARVWTDWITERFSGYFIPITVLFIFVLILIFSIVKLVRRKAGVFEFIVFALLLAAYTYSLFQLEIIIEQVHFLEYGLLGFLIIKAIRTDRRDAGGYLIAIVLITLLGIIDEYIQGILPNRVGELHDVYLNILSGVLALCWYRIIIKPGEDQGRIKTALSISLPVFGLVLILLGFFNSNVSEFGYFHIDEEIGSFYSRLDSELLGRDFPDSAFFKSDVAPRLYVDNYSDILKSIENPIHSEVIVHIFRRDRHIRDEDYITSHRENQLLEKYFGSYIAGTRHEWDAKKKSAVEKLSIEHLDQPYSSPVSAHIITAFTERQQWIAIVILNFIIIFTVILLIRNPNPDEPEA